MSRILALSVLHNAAQRGCDEDTDKLFHGRRHRRRLRAGSHPLDDALPGAVLMSAPNTARTTQPSAALVPQPGQRRMSQYRPACATDVRATFERVRKEQARQSKGAA